MTAALGVLAACGSQASSQHSPSPSSQHPASTNDRPVASAAPTVGLLPASPGLTDRIVLARTRAVAGQQISGTLEVTYRGSRPLNLTKACRPQFAVVLTNEKFPPTVAFPALCLTSPFLIKPGLNRLPFTLATTFPAGHYQAVLVGDGLALPPPSPVSVTLTASAG